MTKGDIVLVPFPFTDLSGVKNRPALVLVAKGEDVTLAFITSQLKWREEGDLQLSPSDLSGLKKPSLLRLGKLATLDRDLIFGRLGNLADSDMANVDDGLVGLFKLRRE